MSDDDQEARNKAHIAEHNRRVEAGEPLFTFPLHEMLRLYVTPDGEVLVDFAVPDLHSQRSTIFRLVMSRQAARTLKSALGANESIPDTPPPGRDPQSTH